MRDGILALSSVRDPPFWAHEYAACLGGQFRSDLEVLRGVRGPSCACRPPVIRPPCLQGVCDPAARSGKARVTAAVRLDTWSLV